MNEKSLQEIIEKNKKILIAKFQEGFLAGFRDAEQKLISEFLEDLKERDDRIACQYRIGGESCEECTNYGYCDDCNHDIRKKWEQKLQEDADDL